MKIVIKHNKTDGTHLVNAGLGPADVDPAQYEAALTVMDQLVASGQASKLVHYDGQRFTLDAYTVTPDPTV